MALSGRRAVCLLASGDEKSILPTKPADSDTREGDRLGTAVAVYVHWAFLQLFFLSGSPLQPHTP